MKSFLIVEDNEVIVKGLRYLLEQEKFKVSVCKNAKETMDAVGKQDIDLVVLDITLPDGDGFELCKYIKQYTDIPIIFLTAKDEEQDVVKGFDLGAEDYIIKPFRNRELLSRINNVLRRFSRESNEILYKKIRINISKFSKHIIQNREKNIKEKEYIENRRFICSTCSKALIFLCFQGLDGGTDVDRSSLASSPLTCSRTSGYSESGFMEY